MTIVSDPTTGPLTIQERVKVCELKIMKLESTLDDLVKPLERLKTSVERVAEGLLRLNIGGQPLFTKETLT